MDQRYCGLKLTKVSQLNNDPEQGAKEAFAGRASTVVLVASRSGPHHPDDVCLDPTGAVASRARDVSVEISVGLRPGCEDVLFLRKDFQDGVSIHSFEVHDSFLPLGVY